MGGPLRHGEARLGIRTTRWVGTTVTGNNHPSATSPPSQSSVPSGNVSIPSSFAPDWECYDSNSVSNKKFFRNIQSTPWSTKSGLAGKDIADLRVTELTRKGLDDFIAVSAAYPTENSRVWFSCDPSQKQFLFQTCFATSGRIVLIWMLWQPICMARLPLTSIKSRRGSCNLCLAKLFQQSSLTPLHLRRRPESAELAKAKGSCRKLELL